MPFRESMPAFKCPDHLEDLTSDNTNDSLVCPRGCQFPVVDHIPRFVEPSNYADAFGRQWKIFQKTQLDSNTRTTIFRDRLAGALGGSLEVVRGKSVLEAGCGAGPFTEVLLQSGAQVCAMDLSSAVEANYANFGQHPNYSLCQANILKLPFAPKSFDFVLCLGVIQHTPDPEKTIATLAKYLKPGGTLVIDHYALNYPYTLPRKIWRSLLLGLPSRIATPLTLAMCRMLLPIHKLTWSRKRFIWRIRTGLGRLSPLVDHFDDYPQLRRDVLSEWCVLNTHDTLLDYYKHLRSVNQIKQCLVSCGLTDVEVYEGGNGVEARARAPISATANPTREIRMEASV